jgi:hypothetical protein
MNNRFRIMNNRLRENMSAIITSLKSQEPIDEDTVKDIKSTLLNIKAETSHDLKLIKEFYALVRKQGSIRDSLSASSLPKAQLREALSEVEDSAVQIIITETKISDRYSGLKNYSVAENLKMFKKHSQDLYELVRYNYAADEKKQARYFLQASKMVADYRYLMRVLGTLPWTQPENRDYFLKHLTAFYNRLEDYGWLCEGSQALGLLPLKQNSSEYDNRDFEKKLARFMDALQADSCVTPYPKPAVSLKKIISKLDELTIENNQVSIRGAVTLSSSSSSPLQSTELVSQHSSVRVSTRLSLLHSISSPVESKIASGAEKSVPVVVNKTAMKRKISAMDVAADSLLTLFNQTNKATAVPAEEKKRVRLAIPDPGSQQSAIHPLQMTGLFRHRQSILLRSAVAPVQQVIMARATKK